MARQADIRNFAIIAHIDHGKSTLADRILERTGTVSARDMKEQLLDRLDLERERGITIKLQAVRIDYTGPDGHPYTFNLIDTPGHVDFTYEVSRSLAACEGAILLVDASQGIQAQTIANLYLAIEQDLVVIPVLNKLDLPAARPEELKQEIRHLLGAPDEDILGVSAKTGAGVDALLARIAQEVPPPKGDPQGKLRALLFDSHYDTYRGVIVYIRVVDGAVRKGDVIQMMMTGRSFEVTELGVFRPDMTPRQELQTGEVGYLICTIRNIRDVRIGDTVTLKQAPALEALQGYVQPKQMVFCGLYPVDADDYSRLTQALEKLSLNDASFSYEPETSSALGFGYRTGFLGLLHMEVIRERLEREYDLALVITVPNVEYEITLESGEKLVINNPADYPERRKVASIQEPYVRLTIISPAEYIGAIMDLNHKKRGIHKKLEYLSEGRVDLEYELPLAELIVDYYDRLKAATKGYASLDYEFVGFRESTLVKVNILVNEEPLDALSFLCDKEQAYTRGRDLVQKLRKQIPRHLFDVPIQASVGVRVIARETIKALRKDVTSKCYGGDISRKRKLLEKQKEGKKRMKMVGNVTIPQEAFLSVLDITTEDRDKS